MEFMQQCEVSLQWQTGTQYLLVTELLALVFSLGGLAPLTDPWHLL